MTSVADSTVLLDVAKEAALAVETQLCAAFRSTMAFDYKRDLHDIVTEHDRASEQEIVSVITRHVPDSTIIGEEGGRQGDGSVVWMVDPIDGTTNFARGIAYWCVSIAAVISGRIVAGVIYDPVAKNMFCADLGGAWLNGVPLRANAVADEHKAVLLSSFPNPRHLKDFGERALAAQVELLNSLLAIRNLGSGALQLAHVAAGWADATLGFSTNPWDVAAGMLILEQAGGRYEGLDGGSSSAPAFLAPDYLAVGAGANYPTLDRVTRAMSGSQAAPRKEKEDALWRL